MGMVLVALAGPIMNFILAFVSMLGMGMILKHTGGYLEDWMVYVYTFLNYCAILNIGLGSFNLIPFPPLDGSKIVEAILPEDKYFGYMRYERYGQAILMLLIVFNVLDGPLDWMHNGITERLWHMACIIIGIA